MKALMTCFEDFSNVKDNTSRLCVETLGIPYQILPVSYKSCDQTLPTDLDVLIQVGVAASRDKISIERYAHNLMHAPTQSDNDGYVASHEVILSHAPSALETRIDVNLIEQINGEWEWSLSAGSYVCNALYFKSLFRFPKTKILFIHVPHHLKASNPEAELKKIRTFLLEAWTKITENKVTS